MLSDLILIWVVVVDNLDIAFIRIEVGGLAVVLHVVDRSSINNGLCRGFTTLGLVRTGAHVHSLRFQVNDRLTWRDAGMTSSDIVLRHPIIRAVLHGVAAHILLIRATTKRSRVLELAFLGTGYVSISSDTSHTFWCLILTLADTYGTVLIYSGTFFTDAIASMKVAMEAYSHGAASSGTFHTLTMVVMGIKLISTRSTCISVIVRHTAWMRVTFCVVGRLRALIQTEVELGEGVALFTLLTGRIRTAGAKLDLTFTAFSKVVWTPSITHRCVSK